MPEEVAPVVAAAAVTLAGEEADMAGVGIMLVAEVAAMVEVVTAANPAEAEEVTVAKEVVDMAVKAMALVIEHTTHNCRTIPLQNDYAMSVTVGPRPKLSISSSYYSWAFLFRSFHQPSNPLQDLS